MSTLPAVAVRYHQIRQKKGEAQAMVKAGFPRCFTGKDSVHCNTCIRTYRKKR